ncbi:EAP30/Vps36 family-domain-containing protein [Tricharina praecox]|uniref:EAP30/Vps36 family-domain-containing protein n=1 Tax=Tricharina praecox TaxID=43433 RepID=UPI00221F1CFD|nr:EAP30/Vps36 family-domain-containing protein [Tricharina praecox]KAI5853840.1 EAP30/Vps36 family-domain-containing protein [Tricharina praecox]
MLTKIDLTPANRPQLLPDETLLFVQNSVGLYEGKYKILNYQNGFAYLTSHRACYVDNDDPRKYSIAVELKEVDRIEPYAGFLKSSPKITLYLQPSANIGGGSKSSPLGSSRASPRSSTPLIRAASPPPPVTGVWICTICSFSNPIPLNYVPGESSAASIPPCLTCGIRPQPSHLDSSLQTQPRPSPAAATTAAPDSGLACPRCTFHNHPSLHICELCGESLQTIAIPVPRALAIAQPTPSRTSSPAPVDVPIIKFSFRAGGSTAFLTHLKSALIQRKWLLSTAPPVPRPPSPSGTTKRVGIGGLERKTLSQTRQNEMVLGSAFEDLESLKAAAKEVIALAESFARLPGNAGVEAIGGGAAQALGLVSRDMFSNTSSAGDKAWIDELSRQVAEFLADDARGVLKKEGGVITLVDLWALYNRVRGIDLISPQDLQKATTRFEALRLPVRTRTFKSGLVVVQDVGRRDDETVRRIVEWIAADGSGRWGRGVTAGEAADRFGWSLRVASEELEMAEERGALCREVGIEGVRFWGNWFVEDTSAVADLETRVRETTVQTF